MATSSRSKWPNRILSQLLSQPNFFGELKKCLKNYQKIRPGAKWKMFNIKEICLKCVFNHFQSSYLISFFQILLFEEMIFPLPKGKNYCHHFFHEFFPGTNAHFTKSTNLMGMNIFCRSIFVLPSLNTGNMFCTLFSTINNKLINSVLLFSWFHDWWQQTFDGNNKISYPKNYYNLYCELGR